MIGTTSAILIITAPTAVLLMSLLVRAHSDKRNNRKSIFTAGELTRSQAFLASIGLFSLSLYIVMSVCWSLLMLAQVGPAWLTSSFEHLYPLEILPHASLWVSVFFFVFYAAMVAAPVYEIWPWEDWFPSKSMPKAV